MEVGKGKDPGLPRFCDLGDGPDGITLKILGIFLNPILCCSSSDPSVFISGRLRLLGFSMDIFLCPYLGFPLLVELCWQWSLETFVLRRLAEMDKTDRRSAAFRRVAVFPSSLINGSNVGYSSFRSGFGGDGFFGGSYWDELGIRIDLQSSGLRVGICVRASTGDDPRIYRRQIIDPSGLWLSRRTAFEPSGTNRRVVFGPSGRTDPGLGWSMVEGGDNLARGVNFNNQQGLLGGRV